MEEQGLIAFRRAPRQTANIKAQRPSETDPTPQHSACRLTIRANSHMTARGRIAGQRITLSPRIRKMTRDRRCQLSRPLPMRHKALSHSKSLPGYVNSKIARHAQMQNEAGTVRSPVFARCPLTTNRRMPPQKTRRPPFHEKSGRQSAGLCWPADADLGDDREVGVRHIDSRFKDSELDSSARTGPVAVVEQLARGIVEDDAVGECRRRRTQRERVG